MTNHKKKQRAFLKWAGGKFQLLPQLLEHFPEGNTLIEPFVGAGSIFLNTNYKRYLLSDVNHDLISLYQTLQTQGRQFIAEAKALFNARHNQEKKFYSLREQFNQSEDRQERAILFLYLNRHCYNGLCRYNQQGAFNVPFGRNPKPYFPEDELYAFYEKSSRAKFVCQSFEKTLTQAKRYKNAVVYCDPPYVPLSKTSSFTRYHHYDFLDEAHTTLATRSLALASSGHTVIISNNNTPYTRKLYEHAQVKLVHATRSINCQATQRRKIKELIAVYT